MAILCAAGQVSGFGAGHHEYRRTVEKTHGRIEVRQGWTVNDPELLAARAPGGAWPRLCRVGLVVAERQIGEQRSRETRSSRGSLPGAAAPLGDAVRGPWGIAHRRHWVLDIALREDERRVRQGHAAQKVAFPRRVARQLPRQETTAKMGGKAKRLQAGWDDASLLKLLDS